MESLRERRTTGRWVAVIVPMEKELHYVLPWLQETQEVSAWRGLRAYLAKNSTQGGALVVLSGIGKVQASSATLWAIHVGGVQAVLNVGVCGGVAEGLSPSDGVLCTEAFYHDVWCGVGNAMGQVQGLPARFTAENSWAAKVEVPLVRGAFATGENFIPSEEELARIKKICNEVVAVDMETAAVAQVAYNEGVPFSALRLVSDTPGVADINHQEQYLQFWKKGAPTAFARLRDVVHAFIKG